MEEDLILLVEQKIPENRDLALKQGQLEKALDNLLEVEKKARLAQDIKATTAVSVAIIKLCYDANNWKELIARLLVLSKRRGQLKEAVTGIVQESLSYLDKSPDLETKLELINTLRNISEGKMFVEVERARLTKYLAKIKEEQGLIAEAAEILQEVQVETYGGMEKREKTEFILEQLRLCVTRKDLIRSQFISRKINTKMFTEAQFHDLKLRYYKLMIIYHAYNNDNLNVCRSWQSIFDTPSVQDDVSLWKEALKNIIIFVILSPFDNEQSDLINRAKTIKKLQDLEQYRDILKHFLTSELIQWNKFNTLYGTELLSQLAFSNSDNGTARWQELNKRVIEHNIRVVSKYYTRISTKRLAQLLDLNELNAEKSLSDLVVSKIVFAKIDRPTGIVQFAKKKDPNDSMNDWANNINDLLNLVEKTCHLINKEYMVQQAKTKTQ